MNSPRSIIEKLNIRKYPAKLVLNKPDDIADFSGLEFDAAIVKDKYDLIFIFIFDLMDFSNHIYAVVEKQLLADNGYLYFAYPKKDNPQYEKYIERDSFFNEVPVNEDGYIRDSNLKFARMVSLDDVFTVIGLKSEHRKTPRSLGTEKSQRVDDYVDHIEDIRRYLQNNEEILNRYNQLTYGYQKDWARYVFSAKKKETQEKRLAEMATILSEGYKSIDLYRRNAK